MCPGSQLLPPWAGGEAGTARELGEVYGDVERVDLMVGLYAEPLLAGFGFSETAFRIFVLMASRRLKSDPAFTDDYRPEVYTPEGLRWAERTTMQSVIARHLPALAPLSDREREVLRLRYGAGLSTAETAAMMGKGQSAVKMLLLRAVDDLRKRCLDEDE